MRHRPRTLLGDAAGTEPHIQFAQLTAVTLKATFVRVMKELIDRIPGDEWAKAGEMRERFGV